MRSVVMFSSLLSLQIVLFAAAKKTSNSTITPSPLAEYSIEWNDAKYLQCNTAATANYMTTEEKKVIYILNMARMNPQLFAKTVINKYPEKSKWIINRNSFYFTSLMDTMQKLTPKNLLYPDQLCYKSAVCHASTTGAAGTVTHDRTTTCKQQEYFNGECCHYGYNTALDILLSLLIDENVPSLGHRYVCLGTYTKLGVSIQPHITYKNTAVLDFKN